MQAVDEDDVVRLRDVPLEELVGGDGEGRIDGRVRIDAVFRLDLDRIVTPARLSLRVHTDLEVRPVAVPDDEGVDDVCPAQGLLRLVAETKDGHLSRPEQPAVSVSVLEEIRRQARLVDPQLETPPTVVAVSRHYVFDLRLDRVVVELLVAVRLELEADTVGSALEGEMPATVRDDRIVVLRMCP